MELNKLSKKAHKDAVEKGFWNDNPSKEHCLMLVVCEIGEMVEADRKGMRAEKEKYLLNRSGEAFEKYIKNTIEDELADIVIWLADIAGHIELDFTKMRQCGYYRVFERFTMPENAFALCKGLSRETIAFEKRIQFGIDFCFNWAFSMGINLEWHIKEKMSYNQSREFVNGKLY